MLLIQNSPLHAQPPTLEPRTWSIFTGFGLTEYFVFGGQYQISEKFSLGGKFSITGIGGPGSFVFPASGKGVGVKLAYYFDQSGQRNFLGLNVFNFEAAFLQHGISSKTQALAIEETIGHDSILGEGLGMYFALGAAHVFPTNGFPLHSLTAKVGVCFDF